MSNLPGWCRQQKEEMTRLLVELTAIESPSTAAHAVGEHVLLASLPEHAALAAALLMRLVGPAA